MGTLNIIGRAERKVHCNAMQIYLTFSACENTSALASKKAMQNCEDFLNLLQKNQIDISKLTIQDIDNSEENFSDEVKYCAEREIQLDTDYSMTFLNQLDVWIQQVDYSVSLSTNFYINNLEEVHQELLHEAINNSRQKAEILAETMHQKITGFETIQLDDYHNPRPSVHYLQSCEREDTRCLSDVLASPVHTEIESIKIIWKVE